jgi:IgGFc binding protein/type IX secretion system substrate protein
MKKFLLAFILLALQVNIANSQPKEDLDKWLPQQLSSSHAGTEFYLTFHPRWEEAGKIIDKILIVSNVATKVTVTVEGKGFEQLQTTKPYQTLVFNLPTNIAQPYAKDDRDLPENDQVWKQYAIHVVSEDPVICYGMASIGFVGEGYLALPVSALGKEYIISSWTDIGSNTNPGGQFLTSYTSAVAPYDKTKVRYTGGGPSFSRTTTGIGVGDSKTYDMSQGDVLLMASIGSYSDLSGSKFVANKNISVISGNFCSYVPEYISACNHLIEQELPTYTWGTEYLVTPFEGRKKNSWVKIFAKMKGTLVYRDGELFGELTKGGGAREGECYLSQRVLDDTQEPRPVVFSSNNPISVTQYNTGGSDDGVATDPFQLTLMPFEQWSDDVVFIVPEVGDEEIESNYINIVYQSTETGEIPEDMKFAKADENGEFDWVKLRDNYPEPGMEFKIEIRGKKYYSKNIKLPSNGVYRIKANSTFTVYSYGYGEWTAYGFPNGSALNDLEKPDTVAPICSPYLDCYGVARDANRNGNSEIIVTDMPDDEEYRSNMASVIMLPYPYSYNFRFDKEDFIPGESRDVFWSASAVDNKEDAKLVIIFRDRNGNSLMDTLTYYPYKGKVVSVGDHGGDFGTVAIGESKTLDYKIVNESETSDLIISYLKTLSDETTYWTWKRYREEIRNDAMKMPEEFVGDQGFEILSQHEDPISFDIVIPPGGEFPFKVRFEATQEGVFRDSVGLGESENCFFGYWLPLNAKVGKAIIEVGDKDFGAVKVGTTSHFYDVIIENVGVNDLIITDYSGPDLTENNKLVFQHKGLSEVIDKATGKKLIITPKGQFVFQVNFTAYSKSIFADEIIFESNAGNNNDNICKLNGNGVLGIEDEISKSMMLYPNPTKDIINIDTRRTDVLVEKIEVIDLQGIVLMSISDINSCTKQLSLESLANGAYIIQITTNKAKIRKMINLTK